MISTPAARIWGPPMPKMRREALLRAVASGRRTCPRSFAGGEKERYGGMMRIEQESVAGREDRRFG